MSTTPPTNGTSSAEGTPEKLSRLKQIQERLKAKNAALEQKSENENSLKASSETAEKSDSESPVKSTPNKSSVDSPIVSAGSLQGTPSSSPLAQRKIEALVTAAKEEGGGGKNGHTERVEQKEGGGTLGVGSHEQKTEKEKKGEIEAGLEAKPEQKSSEPGDHTTKTAVSNSSAKPESKPNGSMSVASPAESKADNTSSSTPLQSKSTSLQDSTPSASSPPTRSSTSSPAKPTPTSATPTSTTTHSKAPSREHELALRHPKEELAKPTRWDTHSWLPLLPASGLLCLHGHDVLGFPIDEGNRARLKAWSEGYMETVAQQRVRWMSFLGTHTGVLDEATRSKMRLLVRLGIPPELRHRVWRLTTGSFQKQRQANVTYDELLKRYDGVPSLFDDQIKKDLSRTLPGHDRYSQEEAKAALGRVLGCYARWQPTIGYCQGMNFVCGILLLIMAEEDTFWLLAAIVEDVLPGFYHPSLIGVNTDTHTLHDLVAIKLPDVAANLEALGLDRDALCSVYVAWFMCLFNQLPSESMLRVWDLLLFEGSKTLFKTSLALLQLNEKMFADLANAVDQGMIERERGGHEALKALRKLPYDAVDSNQLISCAANDLGSIPKALLQRLRLSNCRRVLAEGFLEEVFLKQSRPLRSLRNHAEDDTRKTLLVSNWGDQHHSSGSFVWSGDDAGVICIWDAQTGCCIRRTRTAYQRRVCSMAATGEGGGGHVWVGCQGGVICTFDTRTFELWGILAGHTQDVLAMARVGSKMWTAAGHLVWVWDHCESSDPQVTKELNCFGKDILSLLASESGLFVLCGSIAGFVVLDAQSCDTLAVGSVDEGITNVVEVNRWGSHNRKQADAKVGAAASSEVWCIHGNSVLGCWDSQTFSSGQCKHVGHGKVSCLTALHNGEVWSGGDDGRVSVWNSKNKRIIRTLGTQTQAVSSMVAVANPLLGVLSVWVAHFDGSVDIWVASELSHERVEQAHSVRNEWRARREDLGLIRDLREGRRGADEGGAGRIGRMGPKLEGGHKCAVS